MLLGAPLQPQIDLLSLTMNMACDFGGLKGSVKIHHQEFDVKTSKDDVTEKFLLNQDIRTIRIFTNFL